METWFYNAAEYGIIGNGITNNTASIDALLLKVEQNGGGTICFPAGQYVSGTIRLRSNMTLRLEAGCTILGSDNPDDFPVIDKNVVEGWNCPIHAGLVTALYAENIAVTGRGTIDGRGYFWWGKCGDERPRSIQPIGCKNVLIENVRIINSPMWTIHPLCCSNVTISHVTIKNPYDSPNTDGINPEGCSGVQISGCSIDVGDDCLTLKSGTQDDLFVKQHPCENITISNCTMVHGHGGVVIGSEMSGGVRNVVLSGCVFCGTDRGIRIKTRRLRGGTVENIRIADVVMDHVFCPIVVNCFYRCGIKQEDYAVASSAAPQALRPDTPLIRDISVSGLIVRDAVAAAALLYGLPEAPVDGFDMYDCSIRMARGGNIIPQEPAMTFEGNSFGRKMKGMGMQLRFVKNVEIHDIRLDVPENAAVEMDGCEAVRIRDLAVPSENCGPLMNFQNVKNADILTRNRFEAGRIAQKFCSELQTK